MRLAPQRITRDWILTLTNEDLLDVEARLHDQLATLERRERKLHGNKYELLRSPPDVMLAWERWSRVCNAARARALNPRRVAK
jgi:hypothetical protein